MKRVINFEIVSLMLQSVLEGIVQPLMCECETWVCSNKITGKVHSIEMDYLRFGCRVKSVVKVIKMI